MLIAGIILHGPCYDFVYVAGQVYIDKLASAEIRAQAQGLFVLANYGVGQGLGTLAAGWVYNRTMAGQSGVSALAEWHLFWLIPLTFAIVVTLVFVAGFKDTTKTVEARTA
jgi:MFS family permease